MTASPTATAASSGSTGGTTTNTPPTSGGMTGQVATHTVRSGDTLWQITAAHLGPDATAAQVAAAWPTIYRANVAAIGSDPNLIRPGEVLTFPSG